MRRLLPFLLVLTALSGCFGTPADGIQTGDQMFVAVRVTDADTGATLFEGAQMGPFVLGAGVTGLGATVERRMVGMEGDDILNLSVTPSGTPRVVRADRLLDSQDANQVIGFNDFVAGVGATPEQVVAGARFEPRGPGTGGYEVVATDGANVTYTYLLRDDGDGFQRNAEPLFGMVSAIHIHDGLIESHLEPVEGSIIHLPFVTQAGMPVDPYETGAPGLYRVGGIDPATDEVLLYGDDLPAIIEGPVRVSVTLLDFRATETDPYGVPPTEGEKNYGQRISGRIGG